MNLKVSNGEPKYPRAPKDKETRATAATASPGYRRYTSTVLLILTSSDPRFAQNRTQRLNALAVPTPPSELGARTCGRSRCLGRLGWTILRKR
ncbi:hypothetical protein Acsp03_00480 [Actinomadura sp. NBRC 104412]|nr:hypothetical protein Acsp03_00480 [Actinomadura sp. NBRC 104412]